jgi:Predicted transcriptional regulator
MGEPENSAPTAPTASIAMLKALSHPVRQQLMRAMTARGFARAADLAADLGLPANQISFHLRSLADAGLIEEAPERARDRRDRVWSAKRSQWQLGSPEHPVADETLGGAVTQWVVADLYQVIQRLAAWVPEYTTGRSQDVHGTLLRAGLMLTEDDFVELVKKLNDILEDFSARRTRDDPGVRRWELGVVAADDEI